MHTNILTFISQELQDEIKKIKYISLKTEENCIVDSSLWNWYPMHGTEN